MCVQENNSFSRKFENGVVLTTKNTEHPGQIRGKTHKKSKYRQSGFLTVSYFLLLKLSFPDFSLPSFKILK